LIKQTAVIIKAYYCYLLHENLIQHSPVKVNWMCRSNWGIIRVYLDVIDQLLVICSALVKYPRKNGNAVGWCISYL